MAGSINLIKASDGTGNAATATVQSPRSPGATTLSVDTVENIPATFIGTMGTPHTFTDPITSEVITVISEASAVDFVGHVSSTHLEIDTIAPGYTDGGSEVGDIIIIKPTTKWADNVAETVAEEHEDDGTHKSITVAQPSAGNAATVTAAGADTDIDLNLVPKGSGKVTARGNPIWKYLGYAQITSNVTNTSGSPSLVTGLSVNVTIPAGVTRVRVTVYTSLLQTNAANVGNQIFIYSGASSGVLTTQLQQFNATSTASGGLGHGVNCVYISNTAPSAGSIYYSAAVLIGGGATQTVNASSTTPAYILVECC